MKYYDKFLNKFNSWSNEDINKLKRINSISVIGETNENI